MVIEAETSIFGKVIRREVVQDQSTLEYLDTSAILPWRVRIFIYSGDSIFVSREPDPNLKKVATWIGIKRDVLDKYVSEFKTLKQEAIDLSVPSGKPFFKKRIRWKP